MIKKWFRNTKSRVTTATSLEEEPRPMSLKKKQLRRRMHGWRGRKFEHCVLKKLLGKRKHPNWAIQPVPACRPSQQAMIRLPPKLPTRQLYHPILEKIKKRRLSLLLRFSPRQLSNLERTNRPESELRHSPPR